MTTFFIGEIVSGEVVERKNKATGEVTTHLVVNTMLRLVTKEGKPKVYAEDITLPLEYKDLIDQNVGKFIIIPHTFIRTKEDAFLFVDENYSPIVLDYNPLYETKTVKESKKAA